jgi:hypothetical protein
VTGKARLGPVVLRSDVLVEDPLRVVLGFLKRYGPFVSGDPERPGSFDESDLRLANRGGARISAGEIAAILERRGAIERALRGIPPPASLAGRSVPWAALAKLYGSFADIRGVGFSKMTKALHPKRPALIPMLDSYVQAYLEDDDPGREASLGERALALTRGYKLDLDRNRAALTAVRRELDVDLAEVRILDVLIWSAADSRVRDRRELEDQRGSQEDEA